MASLPDLTIECPQCHKSLPPLTLKTWRMDLDGGDKAIHIKVSPDFTDEWWDRAYEQHQDCVTTDE